MLGRSPKKVKNGKIRVKNGRKRVVEKKDLKVKRGVTVRKEGGQIKKIAKKPWKINLNIRVKKVESKPTSVTSLLKLENTNNKAIVDRRMQASQLSLRQTKSKKFKPAVISADMSRLKQPGENKPFSKLKIKEKKNILIRKVKEYWLKKEHKSKIAKAQKLVDPSKLERDKHLIMWSGVIFFMILIVFFWTLNIKRVFTQTGKQSTNNNQSLNQWSEIMDEFSKTMEQVKQELSEIKNEQNIDNKEKQENEIILGATSTQDTTTESEENIEKDKVLELKKRLESLESKDNSEEKN